jgi:hypothetical protein
VPAPPSWLPRSNIVVFAAKPEGEPAGVWAFDIRSGKKALLLRGTTFGGTTISPDGTELAVVTGVGSIAGPTPSHDRAPVGVVISKLVKPADLARSLH